MRNLLLFLKRFGLIHGSIIYCKFRFKKANRINVPGLKHPLYIIPKSVDHHTFKEVFLWEEYNFEIPNYPVENYFIIDGGANIGFSAVFYAKKYPDSTIVSIEPDRENFERLKLNTEGYPNVHTHLGALWYKTMHMECIDKGWGTRGFMVNELAEAKENSILGSSIKDLMIQYGKTHIDILKLDIEGSEKELFSSDFDYWLPRTKCIIVELHDYMREGCSTAVYSAIANYEFTSFEKGENIVFINSNLISN